MTQQDQQHKSQVHVVSSVDDIRITAPNIEMETFPDHLPKRCILFHYPETEQLAKSIAAASGSKVELGEIKWGCAAEKSLELLEILLCSPMGKLLL